MSDIFLPTYDSLTFSKRIARTGFSEVYVTKYHKIKDNKIVSLKCVGKVTTQPYGEYEMLKDLKHPNIIAVLGIRHHGNIHIIYFPWMNRGTLAEWVARQKTFSEIEVRKIFYKMFLAVEYIHSKGIIHHDIKLDNFLVAGKTDLSIKLTDFGLAQYIYNDPIDIFCGTPLYIAPEIMFGPTHTYSSDIWS